MASATLITSNEVTETEVYRSETPPQTRTHVPLAHGRFVDQVKHALDYRGWNISDSQYGLFSGKLRDIKYEGANLFGVMKIQKEGLVSENSGYEIAIGLRNSHDKRFSAGIASGLVVMVCENLDFYGDFIAKHKHTANVEHELHVRIYGMIERIEDQYARHAKKIEQYRGRILSDSETHDLIVQCADRRVFPWSYGEKVLKEFRNPRHEEFEDRSIWAFNNATTEILKNRNFQDLQPSTQRLHSLLGEVCLN
jgi:hypothetical protein